jgi:hypothetical protein
MSNEHTEVSVTSKQSLSLPLLLSFVVSLSGLGGVYATGVANDRELATKWESQQREIDQLQQDNRSFKSDLRVDLREIKDEIREMRVEINEKKRP